MADIIYIIKKHAYRISEPQKPQTHLSLCVMKINEKQLLIISVLKKVKFDKGSTSR